MDRVQNTASNGLLIWTFEGFLVVSADSFETAEEIVNKWAQLMASCPALADCKLRTEGPYQQCEPPVA